MSIGVSLLITALGAIFTFAIRDSPDGLDLRVVGVILMIVGGVGLFLRLSGYGPDNGIVTLPRWGRPAVDPTVDPVDGPVDPLAPAARSSRWRRGRRSRMVEEQVYDPMAEDPTVYRPAAAEYPQEPTAPVTRPVVHEERRRYEEP